MASPHTCRRFTPIVFALALLMPRPAHAVSKEMIQLQTQVQQLIDSVARLQQSNDQQMGVLKDLVQQTVDSVNKMAITVNGMQLKLQNEGDAQTTRNEQLSGQVQALNDSLDELKARMQRMEKSLNDLQGQAQSTNAALGNLPGANGANVSPPKVGSPVPSEPAAPEPPRNPERNPERSPEPNAESKTDLSAAPAPDRGAATGAQPPVGDLYRSAYSDYMAGKYPLASSEFNDLIHAYPDENLAGNAFFYLGEIDIRAGKPSAAIKNYDQVLERYPANAKIPAARLHKGEALLATKQTDAGTRELRALIQRYPNSPEAAQARSRLGSPSASRR